MGKKKAIMKKMAMRKVLSYLVVFLILTSAMPVSVFASNSSDDVMGDVFDSLSEVDTHEDIIVSGVDDVTYEAGCNFSDSNSKGNVSNRSNDLEKPFTENNSAEVMIPLFNNNITGKYRAATWTEEDSSSGDCAPIPDADMPEIYLNDTQESVASRDSANGTVAVVMPDASNDTDKNVSALGCNVYVKIDDDTCVGYDVYVDGVYKLTEGEGGTPDGYCAFYVSAGTHTIEIRKNGCSASITKNFQCGITYRWVSMPDYWCEYGDQEDEWEVKFRGTAQGDPFGDSSVTCQDVSVTELISGGEIPDYVVVVLLNRAPKGYFDSSIQHGDKVEVYGKYSGSGCDISINGENYYIKKVEPSEILSINVWTDKSEYKIGETVTIYYQTNKKCTAKLTITKPDGGKVVYGPNEIPACTRSKSPTAGYPTGKRTVVFEAWAGDEYKKATCYFDIVEENKPDLIVSSINFNPNPANKDDDVIVSITVKNQGNGDAGPHYEFLGYPDRFTLLKEWYCSGLKVGASRTFTHTLENVQQSDTYEACADWGQVVQESNENNNCLTANLEVKKSEEKPDLIIQDITCSPSSPKQGDTITFTVKIKNQGSGSAGVSYVYYYIDGSYVDYDYVPALSAGSTSTQSFTWTADKCGNVQVKAVADATNVVDECNENNNERVESINIKCQMGPKIIIPDYAPKKISAYPGSQISYIFTIQNMGNTDDTIKLSAKSTHNFDITIPDSVWLRKGRSYDIKMKVQTKKGIKSGDTITITAQSTGAPTAQSTETVEFWPFDYPFGLKLAFNKGPIDALSIKAADSVKVIKERDDGRLPRVFDLIFDPKTKDVQTSTIEYKITDLLSGSGEYDWGLSSQCALFTTDFDVRVDGYWFPNSDAYLDYSGDKFLGKCNGMVATSILYFRDKLPLPEDVTAVYELDPRDILDNNRDFTVENRIDIYQEEGQDNWAHFRSMLQGYVFSKEGEFNTLKSSIKRGEPVHLGIKLPDGGHGLVVYKIIETDDAYYLPVYDCNHPDEIRWAKIDKNSWHFSYFNAEDKFVAESLQLLPEASFTYSPENPAVGEEVTFDASDSIGPSDMSYDWVISKPWFIDVASDKIISYTFSQSGKYKVELFVSTKGGATNSYSKDITVTEKEKKSDLTIQDISWTPKNPKQGDTVTFTVTVKNIGKGTAKKSTTYIHLMNFDTPKVLFLYFPSCPSLKPGGTHTYTRNAKIEDCGEYSFVAGVDIDEKVNESNEGNNYKRIYFTVPCKKEKPDLIISDISMTPSSPKQGDDVKFTVTVKNIGKGTAKKSTSLIYLINGDKQTVLFLYFPSCPPLKPGVTHTYTKNAKIEDCGEYRFRAFVDVSKEVDESNEENNRRVTSFTVPCPKKEGTLVVNVYSIDGKPATEVKGTTTIELIKSGDVSPTSKQSIDDKSRVTFTDIPIGDYYINVYHDPQLEQGSKEFWGKRKDISITAGKTTTIDFYRYNPYVDKFYAEKNSVEVNTPVKINVGIKVPSNYPDAEAYVKALVIIRDESGHEVYRDESDDRIVQKGDSTTFSFSYTPTKEGTYSGLAKAYIVGGGELCTDNCGWMKVFTCSKEESDLVIHDIAWKPKNPESGDPVDFTITVKNAGTKDVDSIIYVDFETGATQQPRKKVADSLKSGETATVTYNGILKKYCLSYLAQATVDPDNTIAESDNNNNYKAETVDIAMKYALIVGINNYEDKEISQLDTAVRYANKMKKLLISGYNYDEVKLLTEEDATKHTIGEYLTQFSEKVDSNDIFVFYFFGHGTNNTYHKEEIVAHDLHRLSDEDFVEISNNFKGTVICIFESCNSGGMAYDTDNSNGKTGIDRDNAIVLMSCQANEDSYESKIRFFPWLSDAIYPKYLYEAFVNKRQDADKNNDGKIALEEAHNYAWKKTIAFADSHGKSQHPQIMDHYKSKSHPEAYCYFSRHPINPEFINE